MHRRQPISNRGAGACEPESKEHVSLELANELRGVEPLTMDRSWADVVREGRAEYE